MGDQKTHTFEKRSLESIFISKNEPNPFFISKSPKAHFTQGPYERLLSVDVRISPLIVDVQLHGVKQPKQYLAIVDSFDVEISCSKDIPKPRTPTPPPTIFITKITIQKAPTVQVSIEMNGNAPVETIDEIPKLIQNARRFRISSVYAK